MNDTLGSRSNDSLNALVGLNESSTLFGSTTSAVPLRAPLWIPPAMIRLSRVGAPLAVVFHQVNQQSSSLGVLSQEVVQ